MIAVVDDLGEMPSSVHPLAEAGGVPPPKRLFAREERSLEAASRAASFAAPSPRVRPRSARRRERSSCRLVRSAEVLARRELRVQRIEARCAVRSGSVEEVAVGRSEGRRVSSL